jgi:hypothetical protein
MAGLALAPGMRFAQLAAMNKLSQTAGFAPGFTEQLAAARGRAGIQSGMPATPALGYTPPGGGGGGGAAPAAGPVNPATMYAGSGGVSADLGTAGAAALNVKYPPYTPPPAVPQAAAERVATSPSQSLAATPRGQEILAQLQQRAQASGAKYTPPRVDTPTVQPVAPQELPAAAPAPAASTLDQLRSRLTPQTPEQAAAVEAYNALSPAEKAAQTREGFKKANEELLALQAEIAVKEKEEERRIEEYAKKREALEHLKRTKEAERFKQKQDTRQTMIDR